MIGSFLANAALRPHGLLHHRLAIRRFVVSKMTTRLILAIAAFHSI